jgi:hypothetical protein
MTFLNRNDIIVNEKYKQLFIFCQSGGVRTMNIYNCWRSLLKKKTSM